MFRNLLGLARKDLRPQPYRYGRNRFRPHFETLEKRLVPAVTDNLVVHLAFDGDATDSSGEGNDGAIYRSNGVDFAPGIIGQAFETTGNATNPGHPTGNFVSLNGNYPDLNFGVSTDFSIAFWGKYTTANQHDDVPWLSNKDWTSGGNVGWVLASQGNGMFKWNYEARGESRADSPQVGGTLDNGQWHSYVVSFSRLNFAVTYLDGVQVDSTHLGSFDEVQYEFNPLPVNIMQDGTGDYTDGNSGANWDDAFIDDVGIWQRAVTQTDVTTIYQCGQMGMSALDGSCGTAPTGHVRPANVRSQVDATLLQGADLQAAPIPIQAPEAIQEPAVVAIGTLLNQTTPQPVRHTEGSGSMVARAHTQTPTALGDLVLQPETLDLAIAL